MNTTYPNRTKHFARSNLVGVHASEVFPGFWGFIDGVADKSGVSLSISTGTVVVLPDSDTNLKVSKMSSAFLLMY